MPLDGRGRFTYKDKYIPMQTGAVINVTLQGCTDFWKSRRHLKILGARQVTWDKFNTLDSQILGSIVQNVAATVWRSGFVHSSLVSQLGGRLPDKSLSELTGCNSKIKSSAACLRIASNVHPIHNRILKLTVNPLNAELNPICHSLILLGDLTFLGPCIVSIFQYIFNKMQLYTVYLYLETALHVSGGTSPIIRSAYNCIYSIWYLSHRYCYLLLSWKSWNRFECVVGGVHHPQHTTCHTTQLDSIATLQAFS